MSDPTFTEDEARRILARATARQESVERAQMDSGGSMTLAELTSIAREVDIDADHVRAASSSVKVGSDTEEGHLDERIEFAGES